MEKELLSSHRVTYSFDEIKTKIVFEKEIVTKTGPNKLFMLFSFAVLAISCFTITKIHQANLESKTSSESSEILDVNVKVKCREIENVIVDKKNINEEIVIINSGEEIEKYILSNETKSVFDFERNDYFLVNLKCTKEEQVNGIDFVDVSLKENGLIVEFSIDTEEDSGTEIFIQNFLIEIEKGVVNSSEKIQILVYQRKDGTIGSKYYK